jgi:predicted nucleotidyltransferase
MSNDQLKDVSIDKIISEIHSKTRSKIRALAFVGSRAAGYYNEKSDYDFLAFVDGNFPMDYRNFLYNNKPLSVKIEDTSIFENRMLESRFRSSEQGCILSLPYIPLIGKEYLSDIETESRNHFAKHMISSFPKVPVKFTVKDVSEWSFIKESLHNPVIINSMMAISRFGEEKILGTLYDKYINALKDIGTSYDGEYFMAENKRDFKEKKSFFKRNIRKGAAFFGRNMPNPRNLFFASSYALVQVPEIILNRFYTFPRYKEEDGFLIYNGPSMKKYLDDRPYLMPLRNLQKKLKYELSRIE